MIKLQDVIYIVGIKELFDGDICMYVKVLKGQHQGYPA